VWVHYPTLYNRYFEQRRTDDTWEMESPKLILSQKQAAIHFLQTKTITAKKIVESKQDPDLVTVAVDLNVKYLAVLTVRQHGGIKETRFVSDQGLDQHRYRHLKRVAKKQWQSGTPIKGEHSNQQIWTHVRRQNLDTAHKTARAIVEVCERYAISTNYIPRSTVPKGFKTRAEFYSPEVLHKVLIAQDFMDTVADTNLRSLFKLVFAATMVSYSNYSYEPSLSRRVTSGKEEIQDFPVVQTILGKLAEVVKDVVWFQAHLPDKQVETRIFDDSFFQYKTYLAPQSVDLIITSPPYLNNYLYNRNTRPQLYWLGYMEHPQDFKLLEYSNFGKYWQTVREPGATALPM
jgi:hypothetical protein